MIAAHSIWRQSGFPAGAARLRCLALPLLLAACAPSAPAPISAAPLTAAPYTAAPLALTTQATPRTSGRIDGGAALPRPSASFSPAAAINLAPPPVISAQGDISLDFAGTDIHTVIDQILGTILQQNYTVDSGIQGSVTLRTVTPLSRDELIPTLQTLLAQCGAVLVRAGGLYRVVPIDQQTATPALAGDDSLGGAAVVPLHYAQATQLAQTLQPYINPTARLVAAADQNALIVEGDPASRAALVALIEAFDVDELAGQSYELFPVTAGDAQDFATAFTAALNKSTDASTPGPISVVPLERINAVLVIARTEGWLDDAQRVYAVLNQVERETLRSWHIYYLHNGTANDAAYVLQQAFTPDNVTAQPTPAASGQINTTLSSQSGASGTGSGATTTPTATSVTSTTSTPAATTSSTTTDQTTPATPTSDSTTSGAAALLGPLSATAAGASTNALRIITDDQHNALLIYATEAEDDRISAMLAKIDITPVEVRIDATIAEVDLNNTLQYGTQFFFKSGGINALLTQGTSAALTTNFPGFVLSGHGGDAAPLAISLLQSVTKVNVLSSPELMVLDGQSASLQVGDLVPYLSQTSQSTVTSTADVINSIDYRETGVILQITPHVGGDGLVTLDVSQEVSGVVSSTTTAGINSPTFSDRAVTSRIAIQDGQTVGLAGLISDSDSHINAGIPYLKNVPLLGDLFSNQNNQRSRTELLVLITPHVIRTQSDAADLTEDLKRELPNAAAVPYALPPLPAAAASDPDANLRSQIPP